MRKAGPFAGIRRPHVPLFAFAVLSLLASAGCASRPPAASSDFLSALGSDASLYVVIPARSHRPLLDLIAEAQGDGDGLQRAFDRTDLVYASVSQSGSLRMIATGSFPRSGASLYFPSSKGWKKTGVSGVGTWYASPVMEAAVPKSGMVLLASAGGMEGFLGSVKSPVPRTFPLSFSSYASNAETDGRIGVYLARADLPAEAFAGAGISLPVRYAEIYAAAPDAGSSGPDAPYLLSAHVVLHDARTARAMSALLRVTTGAMVRLDGESVYIDSFPVAAEKLAELAGKLYFY